MDSILELSLIFLTIIIVIVIIIYAGVKNFQNSVTRGIIYSIVALAILFVILNIKIEPTSFYKDYNYLHQNLPKMVDGTWTTVYQLDDNKVLKQISAPGVSHTDFTHVSLPSFDRKCTKLSCTLPVMMAHKYTTNIMWKSLKKIYNGELADVKYFPKIYHMDDEKRYYIQEYIPHDLKDFCPEDFEYQLQDLQQILLQKGVFLDDVHSKNWKVDDNGVLKIIDCEVYTTAEKNIQQFLLNIIDGSQDGVAKGHQDALNILHWNDGRPCIYDICKIKIST